mgnify:CR=1 FL=1
MRKTGTNSRGGFPLFGFRQTGSLFISSTLTEIFYDKNPEIYETAFEIYQEAQMSGMKENDTAQTFHDTYNRLYDEFLDRLFEENLDHQSK